MASFSDTADCQRFERTQGTVDESWITRGEGDGEVDTCQKQGRILV